MNQGDHIFALWFLSTFYLSFFIFSPNLSGRRSDVYHTSTRCSPSANLECTCEMCCTWLAANTRRKNRHFGTIAQLYRAISSELRHVSTIGKKLLNNNISSTCPDNMVNFGLLTAEICWRVWGTPANSTGFASWQRYCTALYM